MTGRGLLELEKLTFDRPHPGHQTVEFPEKESLILLGLFDQILGGAMADPLKGIGQLPVQVPHGLLQIQKFLMQLALLEHTLIPRMSRQ